jgi:hypothetical protein
VVEGEAVIIDLVTRRVLGLNRTGSLLWSLIDGRRSLGDLAAAASQRFGLSPEAAERDTRDFVGTLVGRGLIGLQT